MRPNSTSPVHRFTQTVAATLGLSAGGKRRRHRSSLTLEYLEGRALPSATTGVELEGETDDLTSEVGQTSEQDAQDESTTPSCQTAAPEPQDSETEPSSPCALRDGPLPPPQKPPLPPPELLRHFLNKLYAQLLHREADQGGLECWKEKIDNGMPREEAAQAISASQEGREVKIKELYRKHLGREADEGGVQGFAQALNQGATLDQVKSTLVGSEEFFKQRAGGDHQGFVKALYKDVLNREVDPAGAAAWAERLAQGETTGTIANQILGSEECKKERVKAFYQQLLNRPADDSGLHEFVRVLQQGTREERVQCQFLGSQEFYDHE